MNYQEFLKAQMFMLSMESNAKRKIINGGKFEPIVYVLTDQYDSNNKEQVCASNIPDIFGDSALDMLATKLLFNMLKHKIINNDGFKPIAGVLTRMVEKKDEQFLQVVYDYNDINVMITHKVIYKSIVESDGTFKNEVEFVEMED